MKKRSEARILIAAPKSGSGKTTVTCALLGALKAKGIQVRACKCGPDYIDPMFHRLVLGIPSGNLDTFFTDEAMTGAILKKHAEGADLTVLEGAMGFFDGRGGTSGRGSACEIASVTKTPVILVADAKGASVSLAAVVRGLLSFEAQSSLPGNGIAGVILNRVSASYYPRLKAVIEENCGVPVLGYLPQMRELSVPSRHLGLISPGELEDAQLWTETITRQAEATIDLDTVLGIAEAAAAIPGRSGVFEKRIPKLSETVRIAVARDEAFSFYYEENDMVLKEMGAELVPFSPLHDRELPQDIDGLILGGGYPELFVKALKKGEIRKVIRKAVRNGLPCIAECGGFLYLNRTLEDAEGHSGKMAGVLNGHGFPTGKLCRFGYCEAKTLRGGLFGDAGTVLRGHEFHHWDTDANGDGMLLTKPLSGKTEAGVVYTDTLAAGFPHFYYAGCPDAAYAFLEKCRRRKVYRLAKKNWDAIAHPLDGLGRLETLTQRLCAIAGSAEPYALDRRAAVVFCGDHGVVKEGVSQSGKNVTRNVAEALAEGNSVLNHMAAEAGADVFVVDTGICGRHFPEKEVRTGAVIDRKVAGGTKNLVSESAMTRRQCLKAIAAGEEICRALAGQGFRILVAGEMGIGNTTAAAACTAALLDLPAEKVVGRGAGLDDEGLSRKRLAVERALARLSGGDKGDRYKCHPDDDKGDRCDCHPDGNAAGEEALTVLTEVGGYEIAALAGLFIGGAKCGLPVVADGAITLAAACAAQRIDPRVKEILIISHKPAEPAGKYLLRELGQKAILHGNFHLGEGSGGILLMPLLDMAEAVYAGTPSFAERGLKAYQRYVEEEIKC